MSRVALLAMTVVTHAHKIEVTDWPLPFSAACSPFDSCGNHRFHATWHVDAAVPGTMSVSALRVRLEWRRPRFGPVPSTVLAQLLHPKPGASVAVRNVLVHPNSTHEAGDVVFDPENATARAYCFALPFSHGHTLKNGGNITVQYSRAAAEHCNKPTGCNNATHSVDPLGAREHWRTSTRCHCFARQFTSAHKVDRFGPLEWAATSTELRGLLQQAGNRSVLPFVESRDRPIFCLNAIPQAWAVRGPD